MTATLCDGIELLQARQTIAEAQRWLAHYNRPQPGFWGSVVRMITGPHPEDWPLPPISLSAVRAAEEVVAKHEAAVHAGRTEVTKERI